MKSKMKNTTFTNGYIFSHTLKKRTSKKGVDFVNGEINVATDEAGTNVIPVHFSYVTQYFGKTDKINQTYNVLLDIIENGKTFENYKTDADKVRITGNVSVNDFYTKDGELASPMRIEGSFVHMANETPISEAPSTFAADMLIVSATEHEREDVGSFVNLRGYVFNYRNDILPVNFTIRTEAGMNYFLGQEISKTNPMFTEVRGEYISTTINTEIEIEGAFGEPIVQTTSRSFRAWDVVWASLEPGEFDDESTITKKELKQCLADREVALAAIKERQEAYQAQKNGGQSFKEVSDPAPATTAPVVNEDDDEDFEF